MTVFKSFLLEDCIDPKIYAAQPIWEWQQTEAGKWVMEHAIEQPVFHVFADPTTYGYRCIIKGELSPKDQTFFLLKWGVK
jgi:hypothetical protein